MPALLQVAPSPQLPRRPSRPPRSSSPTLDLINFVPVAGADGRADLGGAADAHRPGPAGRLLPLRHRLAHGRSTPTGSSPSPSCSARPWRRWPASWTRIRYHVDPLMGLMAGLKAFVAAVLGGIGSIPGAVLGGLLIGLLESLAQGADPALRLQRPGRRGGLPGADPDPARPPQRAAGPVRAGEGVERHVNTRARRR